MQHAPSDLPTAPESRYVTVEHFAEIVECSRAHVFNLIRRGELPSLKLGRLRRIPLDAVESMVTR